MVQWKKTKRIGCIAACCLAVCSVTATAKMHEDNAKKTDETKKTAHHNKKMQECRIEGRAGTLQSADELIGMTVKNRQDQRLGTIDELILDNRRQAIAYVVIAANDKLYPVPWSAMNTGTETYTLDITTDSLSQAPSIDSLENARYSDSVLREKSMAHYRDQIQAARDQNVFEKSLDWAQETAAEMYHDEPSEMIYAANQVIGFEVQNPQGNDIGELDDLVFDVREGNLAYGMVSFGGIWGINQKIAAVPWEAIQLESTRQIAQLEADQAKLRQAVVTDGNLNELSDPTFAQRVHQNFDEKPYWQVFGYVPPGGAALAAGPWSADSPYSQQFNPDTVETVKGTIQKVDSFQPSQQEDAMPGLKLKIKTDDGRTRMVCAGPKQHYLDQSIKLEKGDAVTVTGSNVTMQEKNVILATQIEKDGQTLRIRDEQGTPQWNMDMGRDMNKNMNKNMDKDKDMHKQQQNTSKSNSKND